MGKRSRGPLIREFYENGKLIYVDVFTGKRFTPEEFAYWKDYFDFYHRVKMHKIKKKEKEKKWKRYIKDLEKNIKQVEAKKKI